MSRKKKRRNNGPTHQGLCCACDLPVDDENGVYIGDGDFIHYDCMDDLPEAVADEEDAAEF